MARNPSSAASSSDHAPLAAWLEARPFPSFEAAEPRPGVPLHVAGLQGLALSAFLAQRFRKSPGSLLYLAPDAKTADVVRDDLEQWLGEGVALSFPGLEIKPYEWRKPFGRVLEERLECLNALRHPGRRVVIAPHTAFAERLQEPKGLFSEILTLKVGEEVALDTLREALLNMGFTEEPVVQDIGEFSIRGEIVDVYPMLAENPLRIVWLGDAVETIKEFDVFSQRSLRALETIELFPLDEDSFTAAELEEGLLRHADLFESDAAFEAEQHRLLVKRDFGGIHWQRALFKPMERSLLDYLGPDPCVVLGEAERFDASLAKMRAKADEGYAEAREKGHFVADPAALYFSAQELHRRLAGCRAVFEGRLSHDGPGWRTYRIELQSREGVSLEEAAPKIEALHAEGVAVYLVCPHEGQAQRLRKTAEALPLAGVLVGDLSAGFVARDDQVALFTDHQIFNRLVQRQKPRKTRGGAAIPSFEALTRRDYVVHEAYGIGRFIGIQRIKADDREVDCILLEFAGSDKLALPVTDLSKLEKYSSEEGHVPVLSKLGGKGWEKAKEKTKKAIVVLAKELIELYARRSVAPGFAFPADGDLQKEFDASFEYPLTPDQVKAVDDVKGDMQSSRPMDRLICGDVGFGKTEVAMRAAFKAIAARKQVAVLAPTTILAAQHYDRFHERFSAFPVTVDTLHRFRSPAEQKEVLRRLEKGEIDLLIGTHRLLSKDVVFKDLGLLVVDEEQKFGVKQKERLKEFRAAVDVLAMSATPIPRTLHLSLISARDLSIISTPPRNRLPIDTEVTFWDPARIREAIEFEIGRGGQVFFVHNRIQDMAEWLERLEKLVPEARIAAAHGQMAEGDLERVMSAFVNRESDVLLSTAIVESGIDIPSANTMIINRADLFGLSQLYQLRGRVGRSSVKAHCLLVAPDSNRFSDDARKKLYSLEKHTELGSGFQIAMRDLEIRGAGNILGMEQSGHIASVGFETYCRLLHEAVAEMQGHPLRPPLNPEIEVAGEAFLPEAYIQDSAQRTALYQKLSRMEAFAELDAMREELADRFGSLPEPAEALLHTLHARAAALALGLRKIEIRGGRILATFSPEHMPAQADLAAVAAACPRPLKFFNTTPLQLAVELNAPKAGGPQAALEQAAGILRKLAEALPQPTGETDPNPVPAAAT